MPPVSTATATTMIAIMIGIEGVVEVPERLEAALRESASVADWGGLREGDGATLVVDGGSVGSAEAGTLAVVEAGATVVDDAGRVVLTSAVGLTSAVVLTPAVAVGPVVVVVDFAVVAVGATVVVVGLAVVVVDFVVVVVGFAVVVVGAAVVVVVGCGGVVVVVGWGLVVVVVGFAVVVVVAATWHPGLPWPAGGLHVLPGWAVAGPAYAQAASPRPMATAHATAAVRRPEARGLFHI